ncbi:hypothetical protein [Sulfitobacter sp. 1A12157]|uniref:hypothetical protein n=1 Tax=Sulfitobacter sp. 1A12157 TaxID=3368594 RepID=UPI003744E60C
MDGLISELAQFGPFGILLGLSILANVAQYRQNQSMHKENRENDRATLKQVFDAMALLRTATELLQKGGR